MVARSLILAVAASCVALPAGADDITDQIDTALGFYKKGDYAKSVEELEFTITQLKQLQGQQVAGALPEPPAGWTADPAQNQTAGAAVMGGGTSITRVYRKNSGEEVEVTLVANSPMLQGMMMMFSNPMFMGADGGELVRLQGQKGILKYQAGAEEGELTLAVEQKALLTLTGHSLKNADPLKELAKAFDFDKLMGFLGR